MRHPPSASPPLDDDDDDDGVSTRITISLDNDNDDAPHSLLLSLPIEVMDRIGGFLDHASLMRLSETCRRMHAVVQRPETYRRLLLELDLATDRREAHTLDLDAYPKDMWDYRRDLLLRVLLQRRHGPVPRQDNVRLTIAENDQCSQYAYNAEMAQWHPMREVVLFKSSNDVHKLRQTYQTLVEATGPISREVHRTYEAFYTPEMQHKVAWDHITMWQPFRAGCVAAGAVLTLLFPITVLLAALSLGDIIYVHPVAFYVLVCAYIVLFPTLSWYGEPVVIGIGVFYCTMWVLLFATFLPLSTSLWFTMVAIFTTLCIGFGGVSMLILSLFGMVAKLCWPDMLPDRDLAPNLAIHTWFSLLGVRIMMVYLGAGVQWAIIPAALSLVAVPVIALRKRRMDHPPTYHAIVFYMMPFDLSISVQYLVSITGVHLSVPMQLLPLLLPCLHLPIASSLFAGYTFVGHAMESLHFRTRMGMRFPTVDDVRVWWATRNAIATNPLT